MRCGASKSVSASCRNSSRSANRRSARAGCEGRSRVSTAPRLPEHRGRSQEQQPEPARCPEGIAPPADAEPRTAAREQCLHRLVADLELVRDLAIRRPAPDQGAIDRSVDRSYFPPGGPPNRRPTALSGCRRPAQRESTVFALRPERGQILLKLLSRGGDR